MGTEAGSDDLQGFGCAPYDAVYVGRDRLWVEPLGGQPLEVPGRLLRSMAGLPSADSLEQLAHGLATALGVPAEGTAVLRAQLARFAEHGLLLSRSELVRRCSPPAAATQQRLELVSVPTCRRPEALERCLGSHVEAARRFARPLQLSVLDDARSDEECMRARSVAMRFAGPGGCAVRYGGVAEKRRHVALLEQRLGGYRDELAFLFFGTESAGCTIGANRNAQLLDAIGGRYLSVDDDTVGAVVGSRQRGLTLTSAVDPTTVRVFADRAGACAQVVDPSADALAMHDETLGHAVSDLVGRCAVDELALEAPGPRLLKSVLEHRAIVAATSSGTYGDSGAASSEHHAFRDDVRAQLVADEARFSVLLRTRETSRGVERATVTDGAHCQAGALALDARRLLPPFFPVLRGEDVIWGATLRACFENAYIAHVPCAVLHAPIDARVEAPERGGALRSWPCHVYLAAAYDSFRAAGDGPGRLRALGHHLLGLGALDLRELAGMFRQSLWLRATRHIGELEAQLVRHRAQPRFWAVGVETHLRQLVDLLRSPRFLHPSDAPAGLTAAEALGWVQQLFVRWGHALVAWPDIWAAASELASEGVRPTAPCAR
jgi:hypothetical protein